MENKTEIIKALVKVQSEIEPVVKDKKNPIARSTYATLDAILEEILPKLNKNGIFMTQEPMSKNENGVISLGVKTTLWHESGEFMEYEPLFLNIESNQRMNMAQSGGSIITYVKRYAVSAIFGISTDEDKDGIQESGTYQKKDKPKKDLTVEEALNYKINFGKYKGKTLTQISKENKGYLRWLLDNAKEEEIKQAVRIVGSEIKKEENEEKFKMDEIDPPAGYTGVDY